MTTYNLYIIEPVSGKKVYYIFDVPASKIGYHTAMFKNYVSKKATLLKEEA